MVNQHATATVMDALDFFEQACVQSSFGDAVDTRVSASSGSWLHTQTLAKRLGFEQDTTQAGVYVNRRTGHAWVLRWVRQADFDQWHALFRVCFGHDISLDQWLWKYRIQL